MSDPTDNPTPKRHTLRWVVAGISLALVLSGAVWWLAGRRMYTDDRTILARASDATVREVLWTKPRPPGELFNTEAQEYEPSVSPDGNELFFVRGKAGQNAEVFVSRRLKGRWQPPAPLTSVNSPADDLGPRLTPDGRHLLFYSDRPGGLGGYDLWAAARLPDGSFAPAFNLGPSVNTEFNEYSPAPTPDGRRIYFASNRRAAAAEQKEAWRATIRQSAVGDYDLFVAERDEFYATSQPVERENNRSAEADPTSQPATAPSDVGSASADRLFPPPTSQPTTAPTTAPTPPTELAFRKASEVPGVNTPYHEGAPCVSPAGDFLYFASNRPGGVGKFDLYRCRLRDDGTLSAPENLGREINTPENDTDPSVAMGGFHLYFSSDRDTPLARGGYDLLTSESREVYIQRQPRAAPHLGWSWWVLLAAVLVLLPLLSMFRGWNDRHLNLLQKCLLVSVLMHVLLTIALSLFVVSKQIVEYVRNGDGGGGMGGEVAVVSGGGGGGGVDIGAEVRRQVSDTPVSMPEPQGLGQAQAASEELTPRQAAELSVEAPGVARSPADVMTVPVPAAARDVASAIPPAERPAVAQDVQVAPPAAPELRFDNAAMRLTQVEPEVRTPSDAAGAAGIQRAAATPAPAGGPQAVSVAVGATEAQGSGAGAGASGISALPHLVRPNYLSVDGPGGAGKGPGAGLADASAIGAGPVVTGPSIPSQRVAAGAPDGAGSGPGAGSEGSLGAVALNRQGTPGAAEAGAGPELKSLDPGVPATSTSGSGAGGPGLASAPASGPRTGEALAGGALAGNGPDNGGRAAPGAAITPLPAGLPAFAGSGSSKPPGPVSSPAPTLAAKEEGAPIGRAADATPGGASGPGIGDKPLVATGPAPIGIGAGATGTALSAMRPTTRPVDAPGTAGVGGPGPGTGAQAPQVAQLPTPSLPPGGTGPARVGVSGGTGAAPPGPAGADEPNFGGARLANAREDRPVGPGDLASSFGTPSPAPAVGVTSGIGGGPGGGGNTPKPRGGDVVNVPLNLEVAIAGPAVAAPEPLAQRSVAARKPLLEKLGGTRQSEDAVARALAYLARQQEPDGRWTYVLPGSEPGDRGRYPHDMALTGLATLCFLAADYTPSRTGPYREGVANAVNFLIARQREDGDLRGPYAGGGADAGNMYDHAIATLALCEAALMTGDARATAAAMKGAAFIVRAQNRETGGWRYTPGEYGDTSVFGWQVMALHSARQLGFDWPQASREGALKYIRLASAGRTKALGAYQPRNGATPVMSAELLLTRILMGQKLTEAQEEEACAYLPRQSPNDYYGLYYASLSLIQLQNDTWKAWNRQTREHLVREQRKGGDDDGCWDMNIVRGERGGRIYSTALACLTLEVYYRYLPLNGEGGAASQPATGPAQGPELPDIGYLAR